MAYEVELRLPVSSVASSVIHCLNGQIQTDARGALASAQKDLGGRLERHADAELEPNSPQYRIFMDSTSSSVFVPRTPSPVAS